MDVAELRYLFKRLVESLMPDLSTYRQHPVRARVTKVYTDRYVVDVQPIKPDLSDDEAKPEIPTVPLPTRWADPSETVGLFAHIPVDTIVRIGFYGGDPNQPYIDDVLGSSSPELSEGLVSLKAAKDLKLEAIAGDATIAGTNTRLGDGANKKLIIETFQALFDTHTHAGVQAGSGSTGPPSTPMNPSHMTTTVVAKAD